MHRDVLGGAPRSVKSRGEREKFRAVEPGLQSRGFRPGKTQSRYRLPDDRGVDDRLIRIPGSLFMVSIGRRRWSIAEGHIPSESSFSDPALISHETACILNANDEEAHVVITIFFSDREPVGPYRVTVAPRRTRHLRFNDFRDPASIPFDTDFSSVFESDVPIVVQHTRLDSRHAEVSLMSTTAYADS
jgi:hypothetical protein